MGWPKRTHTHTRLNAEDALPLIYPYEIVSHRGPCCVPVILQGWMHEDGGKAGRIKPQGESSISFAELAKNTLVSHLLAPRQVGIRTHISFPALTLASNIILPSLPLPRYTQSPC